jgi:hypothetical protein
MDLEELRVTWGRFALGTHVWHALDARDTKKTLCGRKFPVGPYIWQTRLPDMWDTCHRCAGAEVRPPKPKAMAAGVGR